MLCFSITLNLKLRKFLGKIRTVFEEINPQHDKFLESVESSKEFMQKNLKFIDFSQAFDSILRVKMEKIVLASGLPKETVTAVMMLYSNMKVKICSPDEDTDFFDIVAGVLQGDTLALHLFIIWLDYVIWTSIDLMKENGFTQKIARSSWCPAETIVDSDYAGDIALLGNTHVQAESQLHSLEQATGGIGLQVNIKNMEYMCFNQEGAISIQNGGPLKLVDKFMYLRSSVSSTESDVSMCLAKTWTVFGGLYGSLIYLIK